MIILLSTLCVTLAIIAYVLMSDIDERDAEAEKAEAAQAEFLRSISGE